MVDMVVDDVRFFVYDDGRCVCTGRSDLRKSVGEFYSFMSYKIQSKQDIAEVVYH